MHPTQPQLSLKLASSRASSCWKATCVNNFSTVVRSAEASKFVPPGARRSFKVTDPQALHIGANNGNGV